MSMKAYLKIKVSIEHAGTMGTAESLYSAMNFHMLVEVGSLSETEAATLMWTSVGSFISMDPQVIEEVVPFSEAFSAVIVIAFEYLNIPLRFRILESEYSEILCLRYVLLDLD